MTSKGILALVSMLSVCSLNAMPLSYVTGIGALKRVTCGLLVYSQLYGVISVSRDLFVETFSLLAHVNMFVVVWLRSRAWSVV